MSKKTTQPLQSDHWVDSKVDEIIAWQKQLEVEKLHVDDMKTPSGRIHTGSLEGVIYHDFIAKVLTEKTNQHITSTYVFNDMDPMDGLPSYLDQEEYQKHMGKPLFMIPAPSLDTSGVDMSKATPEEKSDFETAESFAEFYARDFVHAFKKLGCDQEVVWSHELYQSGAMDETIQKTLDNVETLKQIYRDVADYELPEKWFPFQVICPQCQKLGTTLVTDWDGSEVSFECQPNKVEWAEGCGNTGKTSPFGGTGKLLWKVDWPSHWRVLGITVEGAGKDHTSAGGSRDMANAICERVLDIPIPFDIPYEWILVRGAKMSSSKGVGTSAREFTELFPPEVGRFLFANKHYNQVLDFDPTQMAIPDLFDLYDQGARIYWEEETGDQRLGRSFELSQLAQMPEPQFLPRFRDIATWMQHPEINLIAAFTEAKGSELTDQELQTLEDRKKYAEIWIERYAPVDFQLTPQDEMPEKALTVDEAQFEYLLKVEEVVQSQQWQPEELQQELYRLAKDTLGARQGFQAIYLAYLGRTSGPKAAWLLLSMEQEFRQKRLDEIDAAQHPAEDAYRYPTFSDSTVLSFSPEFAATYPSAVVGVAIIKGVEIVKSNPSLETEKAALIEELQHLSTQEINAFPEVVSYREMYRTMGIDWHSRRPSPEALLRRIAQGKDLYTVNTCVDAYNLAVIKNRVSVGAFDHSQVQYPTQLKIAAGGEEILLLGDTEPKAIKAGEVSYFDTQGPYNLDYNYRDAQRTMVTENTTDLLINVDGINQINRHQVEQTLADTLELIQKYCGGTVESVGIIEAQQ